MRSAMPQSFLETSQHRLLVSRFDIDHPVRREPGQSDCGREQILAGYAPQHATPRPCCDPCGEECSSSAVDRAATAAGHFVQRPERQAAFRQTLINGLDAERQNRQPVPRPALKALNALAKRFDNGNGNRRIHVLLQLALGLHVLYLFSSYLGVNWCCGPSSYVGIFCFAQPRPASARNGFGSFDWGSVGGVVVGERFYTLSTTRAMKSRYPPTSGLPPGGRQANLCPFYRSFCSFGSVP